MGQQDVYEDDNFTLQSWEVLTGIFCVKNKRNLLTLEHWELQSSQHLPHSLSRISKKQIIFIIMLH